MPRESRKARTERASRILGRLGQAYPDAASELDFRDPFQSLVATILSAQATDVSVNAATPALFEAYPDAAAMATADPADLEPYLRRIGLFRNKAKNLVGAARVLVERHGGQVPEDFGALLALPGVGRKTANVVAANAFGRPGIAVDTHVGRLARRLRLTRHEDPSKVEKDLEAVLPRDRWIFAHHALILHGRRVCTARSPKCEACPLVPDCPSARV
ncbi:MAG: endonuclease III [Trueperaceae bacterium]|nr:endonuclease III [Trueperaceae bacterium]